MITVKFDRIGRRRDVEDLEIPPNGAQPLTGDQIAHAIHRYARHFLLSSDYEITVFNDGTGSIEQERSGTFTWSAEQ